MQQLFFLEAVVKATLGILLLAAPHVVIKLCGLPQVPTGFWPRLLGATLLGISAATVIEATLPGSRGLGMGGSLAVNFAALSILIPMLAVNAAAQTTRGKILLWLLVALMCALILVEIAHV